MSHVVPAPPGWIADYGTVTLTVICWINHHPHVVNPRTGDLVAAATLGAYSIRQVQQ